MFTEYELEHYEETCMNYNILYLRTRLILPNHTPVGR